MDADSIPWREVLTSKNEELPVVFLAGARYREGMTQAALAEALKIDPKRLLAV